MKKILQSFFPAIAVSMLATAQAPKPALHPKPVALAKDKAWCKCAKVFSVCNKIVPTVAVLARSSRIHARHAMAKARSSAKKHWRSKFLRALTTACAFAAQATVNQAPTVAHQVICTLRFVLRNTKFSNAMAMICIAQCPSVLAKRPLAAKLMYPRSMAKRPSTFLKALKPASNSACEAKVSRVFVPAIQATFTVTSLSRHRSS